MDEIKVVLWVMLVQLTVFAEVAVLTWVVKSVWTRQYFM